MHSGGLIAMVDWYTGRLLWPQAISMSDILRECHQALANANVVAFLRIIREGETSQFDAAYTTFVGGGHFISFDDHPRESFHIERLGVTSTAAGAYQFLSKTWDACAGALSLPDFSPPMQDIAAVYLIRGRGALADVLAGRIEVAISKCAREWASLPGSPYGQGGITMQRALAVYTRYGGSHAATSAAPIPEQPQPAQRRPAPSMPAGELLTEKTMPIPALIGVLATSLIDAFAPLAREKITKEIARHSDSPQVADQVASAIIDTVKAATGKSDPIAAVVAAQADPAVMQKAQDSALETLDRLAPLLDKMAAWDESAWAAEEASRASARQRNDDEPFVVNTPWLKFKFIHLLSSAFVSFSAWFVTMNWASLTPELRGAVITLMIIAGWNGVKDFWMGSSRSSASKDVVIGELSRRKP